MSQKFKEYENNKYIIENLHCNTIEIFDNSFFEISRAFKGHLNMNAFCKIHKFEMADRF